MIVNNSQHETAIVVRRDGQTVVFVRFKTGRLACERATEAAFREHWRETQYPLAETLDRYFQHALSHGATQEAIRGLEKLRAREHKAIASLF